MLAPTVFAWVRWGKVGFLGYFGKECSFRVKNNHYFQVPEHHVIRAMELYGEYPVPDRRHRKRVYKGAVGASGDGAIREAGPYGPYDPCLPGEEGGL